MFKALARLCLKQLAAYKSTLEEDMNLRIKHQNEHHLSFNEKNCMMIRIGEKVILHKWLDYS